MIRTFSWITLCLSVCFGCQSYVDGAKRTLGEVTDDAQITAVVKVRLLNDPEVKGLRINVTTVRGGLPRGPSAIGLCPRKSHSYNA